MNEVTHCKRYKKVAFAPTGNREAIFTRLRCKQWDCDFCSRRNQWIWRNWLIKRLPEVSDEWWLLTLTAHSQRRSAAHSMDSIRSNLDTFFKSLKRIQGAIEYVRVYEPHPTSQAIHTHIIIAGIHPFVAFGCSAKLQPMAIGTSTRRGRDGTWSIKTWVKKEAQRLSMGYIADIKLLQGGPIQASFYSTKYLTKDQSKLHFKGLRHVQVTRGIGSPPKMDNELEWQTAAYITPDMVGHKTRVTDINTGFVIEGDNYWERIGYYPEED